MKIIHTPDPGPLRAKEYPCIGDQLDSIWKFIEGLSNQKSVEIPKETLETLAEIKAVKEKYTEPVDIKDNIK